MKKGFTLVELIAVIVILGLIATIVYPSIVSIINSSKEKAYKSQKVLIVKAAKEWGVKNSAHLPEESCKISVARLIKEGYIENDEVINPKGGVFNGNIEIKYENNQYSYTYRDDDEIIDTCGGVYERHIQIIKSSAGRWLNDHPNPTTDSCKISVFKLISDGYITDDDVINLQIGGNIEIELKNGNYVINYLENDAPTNSCLGS
ncbi:MAG: prepilin-type N-terminal cleavage/methylation domain-containing protein [Bacilli bacterium]|nr:prepilin-type N-terminal cleavage/methylation domain-containing protein [Bacilli bacterium]